MRRESKKQTNYNLQNQEEDNQNDRNKDQMKMTTQTKVIENNQNISMSSLCSQQREETKIKCEKRFLMKDKRLINLQQKTENEKNLISHQEQKSDPEEVEVNETDSSELINTQNMYKVEYVCGRKIIDGVIHYLIKWEGYDQCENTWQKIENLQFIKDYLKQFQMKNNIQNGKISQEEQKKESQIQNKISIDEEDGQISKIETVIQNGKIDASDEEEEEEDEHISKIEAVMIPRKIKNRNASDWSSQSFQNQYIQINNKRSFEETRLQLIDNSKKNEDKIEAVMIPRKIKNRNASDLSSQSFQNQHNQINNKRSIEETRLQLIDTSKKNEDKKSNQTQAKAKKMLGQIINAIMEGKRTKYEKEDSY